MVLETKEKYFKDEIKLVKSLANSVKKKKKGGVNTKKKDIKEKVIDTLKKCMNFYKHLQIINLHLKL